MTTDKRKMTSWFDTFGMHLAPDVTNQEVTELYEKMAGRYDKFFLAPDMKYSGVEKMTKAMMTLFASNRDDVSVLDVGAGTGNSGKALRDSGFLQVDALEPSDAMLHMAEEKKIYRRLYNFPLTGQPCHLPADSYDAIVAVGAVAFGCLPCDAFEEMARLVKPGGYIVNCMRASFLQEIADYRQHWGNLVARLASQHKWELVTMERYPHHFMEHEGMLVIFRVC